MPRILVALACLLFILQELPWFQTRWIEDESSYSDAAWTFSREGRIRMSCDDATNSLITVSSSRDWGQLLPVIQQLDKPRRQVFIEAVIMDLQLKRSDAFGVSFHGGAPFQFTSMETTYKIINAYSIAFLSIYVRGDRSSLPFLQKNRWPEELIWLSRNPEKE